MLGKHGTNGNFHRFLLATYISTTTEVYWYYLLKLISCTHADIAILLLNIFYMYFLHRKTFARTFVAAFFYNNLIMPTMQITINIWMHQYVVSYSYSAVLYRIENKLWTPNTWTWVSPGKFEQKKPGVRGYLLPEFQQHTKPSNGVRSQDSDYL